MIIRTSGRNGACSRKEKFGLSGRVVASGSGILFLMCLAFGCASSSEYQVKYDYLAPESGEGKACIDQCQSSRNLCERASIRQLEKDKLRAEQVFQDCLRSHEASMGSMLCDDSGEITPDVSKCLNSYNRCFGNCGGKVEERKVCVSNCP